MNQEDRSAESMFGFNRGAILSSGGGDLPPIVPGILRLWEVERDPHYLNNDGREARSGWIGRGWGQARKWSGKGPLEPTLVYPTSLLPTANPSFSYLLFKETLSSCDNGTPAYISGTRRDRRCDFGPDDHPDSKSDKLCNH